MLNLDTKEVVRRLADGAIDFGIVRRDAIEKPLKLTGLGEMHYSLFVPEGLRSSAGEASPKVLEAFPLATLEGKGSFRKELAAIERKNRLRLKIEVECASFTSVARAMEAGSVAGILPRIAAGDAIKFNEVTVPALATMSRQMCLAWNPRLLRIRTALEKAAQTFGNILTI